MYAVAELLVRKLHALIDRGEEKTPLAAAIQARLNEIGFYELTADERDDLSRLAASLNKARRLRASQPNPPRTHAPLTAIKEFIFGR